MHKFLLVIFVVILISCDSKVRISDIPGTYVANHKKGLDTLTVRENGTYRHYFETLDARIYTDSGKWELDSLDGPLIVTFHDFAHYWRDFRSGEKGMWPAMPGVSAGRIHLDLNDDLNYYYEQISK